MSKRQNGAALLHTLSKEFEDLCGFDIVDTDVKTRQQAIANAKSHIRWFETHAETMVYAMEEAMKKHLTDKEREILCDV